MHNTNKNILLGTIICLSGSFCYVLMGTMSQLFGKYFLLNQLMFLQSLAGLACSGYVMHSKEYSLTRMYREFKLIYLARGALSLTSIYALIFALRHMSIFNALIILNTTPFLIPFLRRLFLGVRIHKFIFPALFVAFSGVVLILSPDGNLVGVSTLVMFISMIALSLSLLVLEHKEHTDKELSLFYYFLFSAAALFVLLAANHQLTNIPLHYTPIGLLIGIAFFFTQFFVINAAKYISSQLISVVFYSEIIMSLFVSMAMGTAAISTSIIFGITCVILGGIFVSMLEKYARLPAA